MQWSDAVKEYTHDLHSIKTDSGLLGKIYHLLDLTSLNETDTEASIAAFCEKAHSSLGHVAAVCVYPSFVRLVAAEFADTQVKVATVVNFPGGDQTLDTVLIEIGRALQDGAQEIDVVFPYHRYLAGERHYAQTFVEACKAACGQEVALKVILETGALLDTAIIADAAFDALTAGADFIKTSTGKITQGATLEAAATMLLVIRHIGSPFHGLKVSGGIRDIQQAAQYIELADRIMGNEWVNPSHFRIGASRLADELIQSVR